MNPRPQTDRKQVISRRFDAGLTQTELAERIGCSRQLVSEVERGRSNFSLENLRRLAEFFDCTIRDLLLTDDNEQTDTTAAQAGAV